MTIEHWGWISTDENPEGKTHSWNEREDDFASVAFWYQTGQPSTFAARPRRQTAPPAESGPDLSRQGIHRRQASRRWALPGADNLDFYPEGQLFYKPEQAEDAWVEIPFTVPENRTAAAAARA